MHCRPSELPIGSKHLPPQHTTGSQLQNVPLYVISKLQSHKHVAVGRKLLLGRAKRCPPKNKYLNLSTHLALSSYPSIHWMQIDHFIKNVSFRSKLFVLYWSQSEPIFKIFYYNILLHIYLLLLFFLLFQFYCVLLFYRGIIIISTILVYLVVILYFF